MMSLLVDNATVELKYCCEKHGKRPLDEIAELHPIELKTWREKHNFRRREKRKYVCLTCGVVFQGSGNWKQALCHWKDTVELGHEHTIGRGREPEKQRVSWGSCSMNYSQCGLNNAELEGLCEKCWIAKEVMELQSVPLNRNSEAQRL